jgi:hypothetical protein
LCVRERTAGQRLRPLQLGRLARGVCERETGGRLIGAPEVDTWT